MDLITATNTISIYLLYFQSENIEDQIIDRIDQAFSGRKCAKWSKEWPNGGPDPNGPMAGMKWKDYRKELVKKLDARELAKAEKKANQEQTRRKRDVNIRSRRTLEMLESINEDVFDEYFNNAAKDGERSAGVALERELSADQRVRLYQILVSYMKWAFRYMGECPQDAAGTHAVRMYDFVENQLLDLYEYIQSRTNDQ